MAGAKIRVKVLEIRESKQITEKFSKGEMVGVVEGEYPEYYLFEFPNKKAEMLDTLVEDTYVTVHANLKTNRVESKKEGVDYDYYLSLSAWKVEA